jgi:hypothetical protein
MKGEKMVSASRRFRCRDCSNLIHEFDYTFEAEDDVSLLRIIRKFVEDLNKAGWAVIKVIETIINEQDLNTGPDAR